MVFATFDFATVTGGDQLVVGPTHARGVTLDLLMTDVPDLIRVAVVAPIIIIIIIIILFKKIGSARLGESDIHPISPMT